MSEDTYYKDHWVDIEAERLERYEAQFVWGPRGNKLIEPAAISTGQVVADYGCGPGYLSVELAKRVGPDGHVHAFDINADFVERTTRRVADEGLAERVTVTHLTTDMLPLDDDCLDRLVVKNVMVYVDDPLSSFREFRRVVKPGGKVHAVDSDFYMAAFDPIDVDDWRHVLDAGIHAFRTPAIGRKMYGIALGAGFSEVAVEVVAAPDFSGRMLSFIKNTAGYAREGGKYDEEVVERVVDVASRAVEDGTFFALNPQFLVTATV
ncbi:MAG: methyltransferase domain-containing protein [Rhodospirillaceae bacterium]|nr:methyltransferase domain-containing protein [Rhodospirillaceae bacterium]MBT3493505.1 methyltransferase domain-containing protein [Rhodospirillaceae bacterium]MBT3779019.1 methyltransferase domain-containing protein [Rhodospirillaceae bacterium]MBT3976844.1 methyltransferase domain-containing protein [Rhodospirillaceae bacterium]MBT4168280.1 methyltransferase domain-containing protein [Rhodospirillaceae bacterium]